MYYAICIAFMTMLLAPGVKPDSTTSSQILSKSADVGDMAVHALEAARAASLNRWLPHKDPATGAWLPSTSQAAAQQQVISSLTLWDLPNPLYWQSLKDSPYPLPQIIWPTLAANTIKGLVLLPAAMASAIVAAPLAAGFFGFLLLALDDSGSLRAIPFVKALEDAQTAIYNFNLGVESTTNKIRDTLSSMKAFQNLQNVWSWLWVTLEAFMDGRVWLILQELFKPGGPQALPAELQQDWACYHSGINCTYVNTTAGRRMLATAAGYSTGSAANSTTISISAEAQAFLNQLKAQSLGAANATAVIENPVKLMSDALLKLSAAVQQQYAAKDAQLQAKLKTVGGILTKVVFNIMNAAKIDVLQGTHPNDVDLIAGLAAIPAQLPLLASALTVLQPVPPPVIHLNITRFLEAGKTMLAKVG